MTALAIRPMPASLYDQLHGDQPDPGCGSGALTAFVEGAEIVLPLVATDVSAVVRGPAAQVTVRQTFRNPRTNPLEAIYIFPLPPGAAVAELVFTIGERELHARLDEKAKASAEYAQARAAGQRAALLTQERADVFTIKVANVQPGEEVAVRMVYSQVLGFDDGGFVFRFPLVLAERYIPGHPTGGAPSGDGVEPDTDAVPDASRISPPRLLPGVRPATDLGISVSIDVGAVGVADLRSSQHATATGFADGTVTVTLARADELPNRDFVLRIRPAATDVAGAIWTTKHNGDTRFLALLLPPEDLDAAPRVPREVVLVVDTSSSMTGSKMPAAIEASRLVLRTLEPGDHLQVVEFNSRHRKLWRASKPVTDKTVGEADAFLAKLYATGGTEILAPLKDVLRKGPTGGLVRHVVLVTDGQVGNESQIVKHVTSLDQNLRVFGIGIDTAVNAAFLRSIARETGGLSTLLTPSDPIADRVTRFLGRVGTPIATNVALDGLPDDARVQPEGIPDLYLGEPVVVTGSVPGDLPAGLRFHLEHAGGSREIFLPQAREGGAEVARAVAGARVTALTDRMLLHRDDSATSELLALSLAETVLCPLTAFVVVDPTETSGGTPESMVIPAMTPDSWAMRSAAPAFATLAGGPAAGGMMPPPSPMRPSPAPMQSRLRRRQTAPGRAPAKSSGGLLGKVMSAFGGRKDESIEPAPEPAEMMADLAVSAGFADDFDAEEAPKALREERAAGPEPLSSLVLRQQVDGSFRPRGGESVARATIDALRRMLDAGNTDATGTWRRNVAKAARWLLGQLATLSGDERDQAQAVLEQWADALGTSAAKRKVAASLGA